MHKEITPRRPSNQQAAQRKPFQKKANTAFQDKNDTFYQVGDKFCLAAFLYASKAGREVFFSYPLHNRFTKVLGFKEIVFFEVEVQNYQRVGPGGMHSFIAGGAEGMIWRAQEPVFAPMVWSAGGVDGEKIHAADVRSILVRLDDEITAPPIERNAASLSSAQATAQLNQLTAVFHQKYPLQEIHRVEKEFDGYAVLSYETRERK